ncbi:MAG: nuclear transport factor 2 family protein [Terracidiphilus sp.]
MKCMLAITLGSILCFSCLAATAAPTSCDAVSTPNQKVDEGTIRRIEEGWITAEYRGNKQFLECLLEPDYRTSGKSGQIRTRQDVMNHVSLTTDMSKPVPTLLTIVFIHGNSATAHSIMKTTDKDGNPREVHFVDGYTFHDGRWFAYSGADF